MFCNAQDGTTMEHRKCFNTRHTCGGTCKRFDAQQSAKGNPQQGICAGTRLPVEFCGEGRDTQKICPATLLSVAACGAPQAKKPPEPPRRKPEPKKETRAPELPTVETTDDAVKEGSQTKGSAVPMQDKGQGESEQKRTWENSERPNILLLLLPFSTNMNAEGANTTVPEPRRESVKDENTQTVASQSSSTHEEWGIHKSEGFDDLISVDDTLFPSALNVPNPEEGPVTGAVVHPIESSPESSNEDPEEDKPKKLSMRQRSTYDFSKMIKETKWTQALNEFQKSMVDKANGPMETEEEEEEETTSTKQVRCEEAECSDRKNQEHAMDEFQKSMVDKATGPTETKEEATSTKSVRCELPKCKKVGNRKNQEHVAPQGRTSHEVDELLSGRGSFVQDTYTSLHLYSTSSAQERAAQPHRNALGMDPELFLCQPPPPPPFRGMSKPLRRRLSTSGPLRRIDEADVSECEKHLQMDSRKITETNAGRCRETPVNQRPDNFHRLSPRTVPCPLELHECRDHHIPGPRPPPRRQIPFPIVLEHIDEIPTPPPKMPQRNRKTKATPRLSKIAVQKSDSPPPSLFMYGHEYKLVDQEPLAELGSANANEAIQVPSKPDIPECCVKKLNPRPAPSVGDEPLPGDDWRFSRGRSTYGYPPYARRDPYENEEPGVTYGGHNDPYDAYPYDYDPYRRHPYDSYGRYEYY